MSGAASHGLSAPGMPRLPGPGAGPNPGQRQAGRQASGQTGRPVARATVDTSRERSGITPLTWAFILLTIAAIVLGVIVVRNALLATQPGVGPAGMQRSGEVEQSTVSAAFVTPTQCSVTDLTSSGTSPGASGGSTPCPLR